MNPETDHACQTYDTIETRRPNFAERLRFLFHIVVHCGREEFCCHHLLNHRKRTQKMLLSTEGVNDRRH